MILASVYCCPEDVWIEAVVVSELKLRNVQRHIFGRHFVERADHASFEDRPETFNRVGVNRADNVLAFVVIDSQARILAQIVAVSGPRVSSQQTDFVRNSFVHKIEHGLCGNIGKNPCNHVALALHGTNNGCFIRPDAALMASLLPMAVLVFAAILQSCKEWKR